MEGAPSYPVSAKSGFSAPSWPYRVLDLGTKQGIRRNFARRAVSYDRYAGVQRYMAQELLALSKRTVGQAGHIMEIGCGTGYLTQKLRRLNPEAQLVAVDLDLAMIALAQERLGEDPQVAWVVADAEALAEGQFDLIISNAAFQWFTCPGETIKRYFYSLRRDGCLAIATLGPRTFRELATSLARAATALNLSRRPPIAATDFLSLETWTNLLAQAGFSKVQASCRLATVTFPGVMEFLKAIQASGATNPQPRPFSPKLLARLMEAYKADYGKDGGIPVTYEIIWALAWKRRG